MNLIADWPRLMRPEIAIEYAGGESIFNELLAEGLKPKMKSGDFRVYDRVEIDAVVDRLGLAKAERAARRKRCNGSKIIPTRRAFRHEHR